jgi:hypothetical protein
MSSWCPAAAQWRASAPPISPAPMTPIFMGCAVLKDGASAAEMLNGNKAANSAQTANLIL